MSSTALVYLCLVLGICAMHASGQAVVETVLLCDGDFTLIGVDGFVIDVQSSFYGRADSDLCREPGAPTPPSNFTACQTENAPTLINNLCHMNTFCILLAENAIFGNPCADDSEYLTFTYILLPEEEATTMSTTMDPPSTMATTPDAPTTTPATTNPPTSSPMTDPPTTTPAATDPPTTTPATTTPATTVPTTPAVEKFSVTICEGASTVVNCTTGRINICSATYGRSDSDTCPHMDASITNTTNCSASGAFDTVSCCTGLEQCALSASDSFFGDPCPGTFKYLQVEYTCETGLSSTLTPIDVCEGTFQSISCPAGQTLSICSSIYGRSDTTTCPDTAATTSNVNCQTPNPPLVRAFCQGVSSCLLNAQDSLLGGDPCPGTHKYLHVDYTCA